jgi:hypothetical protein
MKTFTISNVDHLQVQTVINQWETLDPNYNSERLDFDIQYIKVGDEMVIRFRKNGKTIYSFTVACEVE